MGTVDGLLDRLRQTPEGPRARAIRKQLRKLGHRGGLEVPAEDFYRSSRIVWGGGGTRRRVLSKKCKQCDRLLPVGSFYVKQRGMYKVRREARCKPCSITWKGVHRQVARAVRSGRLIKPGRCTRCGVKGPLHGHHHKGYDHPLEVQWVCIPCHHVIHPGH